ncbi:chaplin family protein [Streptomyces sp. NPDC088337]|uniref:chaplin n=1 Tax=unclassified Streptomyces TaxID=2593676 RepID=UPI002DD7E93C|nr:chaplin family protein [Streptomyces sp. NBC_01788]
MRQTLSRGVFAAAAATSMLTLYGSPALADSHADGAAANSPGVLSGNVLQVPVHVPVNVCGNTVNVVALLNPAFGNRCANGSAPTAVPTPGVTPPPVATPTPTVPPVATPTLPPVATPTPTVPPVATPTTPAQTPVEATPDAGTPSRVDEATPETQRAQTLPAPASFEEGTPDAAPQLAETGTGALLASSAASAALIAGGAFLYRRGRTATQRQS